MEGVNMMVNKRRTISPQVQQRVDNFVQNDSGLIKEILTTIKMKRSNMGTTFKGKGTNTKALVNNNGDLQIIKAIGILATKVIGMVATIKAIGMEAITKAIVEETQEDVNPSKDHIIDIPEMVVQISKAPLPKPPPPYPQRLAKKNGENQFKKFIDMMKNLSINVPLVEALEKMPGYAKFMKDLVTKKRSINFETIKVTH
ncbi:uncharacterized protein [Nicotiana tomentosiformis]|uniref:uncharacterized protein n=1 Tax=Nicotiana tomentosiformis TaxID=4098 RepID=UPI00388CD0C4